MFLKVIIILLILTTVLSQDEPPAENPPEAKADEDTGAILCKKNKTESSFMVDIISKKNFRSMCVGTLLSANWVATAGDCVSERGVKRTIAVLPAHQRITISVMEDMKSLAESNKANTISFIRFVNGQPDPSANTNFTTIVALLRLKNRFETSKFISYTTLSNKDPQKFPEYRGVVISWKAQEYRGDVYCYKVNIMPMDKCLEALKEYVIPETNVLMCAESETNAPYTGQLGAPLMGKNLIYGIVCWITPTKAPYVIIKTRNLNQQISRIMESDNGGMEKKVCVYWLFVFTVFITYFL